MKLCETYCSSLVRNYENVTSGDILISVAVDKLSCHIYDVAFGFHIHTALVCD